MSDKGFTVWQYDDKPKRVWDSKTTLHGVTFYRMVAEYNGIGLDEITRREKPVRGELLVPASSIAKRLRNARGVIEVHTDTVSESDVDKFFLHETLIGQSISECTDTKALDWAYRSEFSQERREKAKNRLIALASVFLDVDGKWKPVQPQATKEAYQDGLWHKDTKGSINLYLTLIEVFGEGSKKVCHQVFVDIEGRKFHYKGWYPLFMEVGDSATINCLISHLGGITRIVNPKQAKK